MRYVIGMNPETFNHEVFSIHEPIEDWILDSDMFFLEEIFNVIIINTEHKSELWRLYGQV